MDTTVLETALRNFVGATIPPARQDVGQVMQSPPPTIEPEAHLAAADYLIRRWRLSVLFVMTQDARHPVGRITAADITRAVAAGRDPESTRIRQVVDGAVPTLDIRTPLAEATRLMLSTGLRCLPVTDGERLVGILDLTGLCRALANPQAGTAVPVSP